MWLFPPASGRNFHSLRQEIQMTGLIIYYALNNPWGSVPRRWSGRVVNRLKPRAGCLSPRERCISELRGAACPWGIPGLTAELLYPGTKPREVSALRLVSRTMRIYLSWSYPMVPSYETSTALQAISWSPVVQAQLCYLNWESSANCS